MNTLLNKKILIETLGSIPDKFKNKIIDSYFEIRKRAATAYFNEMWDSSGLSTGKFAETVLRFLQSELSNTFTPFGSHIPNFPDACRKIIELPTNKGSESLRIIIPRALVFIYTLRGKRGIGHIGGDLDANEIDVLTIVRVCDWILIELIRIYYKIPLEEAQSIIDSLSFKFIPDIWEVSGKKRVLKRGLSYKEKSLLLLYNQTEQGILTEDLFDWTKYSNSVVFKRDVLKPLHQEDLIEYDEENEIIIISPLGIQKVEKEILTK